MVEDLLLLNIAQTEPVVKVKLEMGILIIMLGK